jgi:hypothetical protein
MPEPSVEWKEGLDRENEQPADFSDTCRFLAANNDYSFHKETITDSRTSPGQQSTLKVVVRTLNHINNHVLTL